MAKKTFGSAPVLEIVVKDMEGKEHSYSCANVTEEMSDRINEIIADKELTPFQMLKEQMVVFWGGSREDYNIYDMRTLLDILNWTNEQVKNRK